MTRTISPPKFLELEMEKAYTYFKELYHKGEYTQAFNFLMDPFYTSIEERLSKEELRTMLESSKREVSNQFGLICETLRGLEKELEPSEDLKKVIKGLKNVKLYGKQVLN